MTREEIIEQVNGLLSEEFEVEQSEFTPDANLKDTLQPGQHQFGRPDSTGAGNLQDYHSSE